MENIFTVSSQRGLYSKRFGRLFQLGRLSFPMAIRLLWHYFKKAIGRKGTESGISDSYYFLTLIHSDSKHLSKKNGIYTFRHKDGFVFQARAYPSSDLGVFNQVWGRKDYAEATDRLNGRQPLSGRMQIIDAGANVGYSSLFFIHQFPDAEVISIEPDNENFEILKQNVSANRLESRIDIRKKGLWNKTTYLQVVNDFRDGNSWSKKVMEADQPTGLEAISLQDILEEKGWEEIDILKMDIEGSEKQVFDDADEIGRILSHTKVLALEIHDEVADRAAIYQILEQAGFTHFEHSDMTIAFAGDPVHAN